MNDAAVALAAALIKRFEGFRKHPYLCPAGVPTIGYGFTYYRDGTPVTLMDPGMTLEAAEELLLHLITVKYMPAAQTLVPTADTPGRIAALTDFVYNLGAGALRASTLRQRALAGLWEEIPAQLARWTRGDGKVLPGLVRRRAAEAAYV